MTDPIIKYEGYTTEDFVQDDDFRKWVLAPNERLSGLWTGVIQQFPNKQEAVHLARKIVETVIFREAPCDSEEYRHSLAYLKNYLSHKTNQRQLILWSVRAAAVLILPLLMVVSYFFLEMNPDKNHQIVQHTAPPGEKSNVLLSDGTSIWLNSGSTLSYEANGKPVRQVSITGEAFFHVAENERKPFLVKTKNYTIKVYGTQFNVRAYYDNAWSETILKEGTVSILLENKEEVTMKAGQRFFFSQKKKYCLSEVNPDLYLNWKDNILKINNEELGSLIVRMERWYGVNIRVEDFERVKHVRYTLTIKTESLREMLGLMNYVTPFSYEINGENVVLKYHEH